MPSKRREVSRPLPSAALAEEAIDQGAMDDFEAPVPRSWWEDFYRVVRRIPPGRVTTYATVAALAGRPRSARHVGFALSALKSGGLNSDIPWHRVLGSRSRRRAGISIRDPVGGAMQRELLEHEGVVVDGRGQVELESFGWHGDPSMASGS